ncbi:hypothetical protein GJAV_G00185220 [Gymnothorax javanicus]|nr:hypothetical protein GJAV_G00185220 [Gymnothorax javanicus]
MLLPAKTYVVKVRNVFSVRLVDGDAVEPFGKHGTRCRSRIVEGMMPGQPTDCLRTVSTCIGHLFRRLPKSQACSESLKLIHSSRKTRSACPSPTKPTIKDWASMKGSISMSSGYGSQDDEGDEFAFFTAKSSFFHQTQDRQEAKGRDGPHSAFIEVHLKLQRPLTVEGTDGGSSGGSVEQTGQNAQAKEVKRIHVKSSTTVREVIQGLLGKFTAENDPSKFTLYRQTHRDGQEVLQKLSQTDHPWCAQPEPDPEARPQTFVLRENDGAGVEWQAFSVPELQNFLLILQKEEELRVKQVERRYRQYREKLCQVLQEAEGKPG